MVAKLASRLWQKGIVISLAISVLATFSLVGQGLYMQGKAVVAQFLLEQAWQKQKKKNLLGIKPWSWADMYPVAELQMTPLNQSFVVANTDSGQALAFAPGLNGMSDNNLHVISAHNDTHFRRLGELKVGDELELTLFEAEQFIAKQFTVINIDVFDIEQHQLVVDSSNNTTQQLILITCFPFANHSQTTTQRLVITAVE
ncbi:sortase [Vibrio sp. TH_r3]|uniref:sortase domain-containing protein n=1 Tax=Vibrio sp. TH_r3 TaxID=3082084 RepID=UPI0029538AF0|nr:sortase [Vibrio sp. TH_r3]MDV7103366.1 sortase [Vibrio sp. TH_r3]